MENSISTIISTLSVWADQFFYWFGVIVAAASIIVKATPSQKDDAILAKVVAIFDQLSIFNPNGKKVVSVTQADKKEEK